MYLTQAEFEDFVKRSLTSDEATMFLIAEGAAEKFIDNHTDTNFNNVSETSKYYDGGVCEIDIDPCTSVTAVASVDSDLSIVETYDSDIYILEPYNSTVKWSLRSRIGRFNRGVKNIKVTAKFSSYIDKVPSEIKLACAILCQGTIDNPSNYKKESLEGYSYELGGNGEQDDRVLTLLAPYRRILL